MHKLGTKTGEKLLGRKQEALTKPEERTKLKFQHVKQPYKNCGREDEGDEMRALEPLVYSGGWCPFH